MTPLTNSERGHDFVDLPAEPETADLINTRQLCGSLTWHYADRTRLSYWQFLFCSAEDWRSSRHRKTFSLVSTFPWLRLCGLIRAWSLSRSLVISLASTSGC